MKKYLFLAEKPSIAKICEKVFNENKDKFDFDATFIGFTSCGWSRFDNIRIIDNIEEAKKIDVSNLGLPNEFYILGYDRLVEFANKIDLNEYDQVVSVVDPDIYGAILINEFINLKGIDVSSLKSMSLFSLMDKDVLDAFNLLINCDVFVKELVVDFKEKLYIVDKTIFFFDKSYKVCLHKNDLIFITNYKDRYTLYTIQFSKELNKEKLDEFKIMESLRKY